MKRDLRICALILTPLLLALLIAAYFIRWAPPKPAGAIEREIPGHEGLSLSVRESSVSPGGVKVDILNESEDEIILESNLFYVHVKKKGQWHGVKFTKNMESTAMHVPVECPTGEVVTESCNWKFYGELPPGDYRVVLQFYDQTNGGDCFDTAFEAAAEFTIK